MRVLLLHNRYRASGGEERAVEEIAALLDRRGHTVQRFERPSEGLSRGRAAAALLRGGEHPEEVAAAVRAFGADVVHAHNLHPRLGWRALAAAREAGARTVLHLHNFRLVCAIAVAYRDGAICHRCSGRNTLPGVRLRCRGTVAEAAVYAAGLHRQQPRLLAGADRLLAVSDALGVKLSGLGVVAAPPATLRNFAATHALASSSQAGEGSYALASGRLVEEKGFDTAILAARAAGVPLVIAGEGPDLERLRGLAAGGEVTFAGQLSAARLAEVRSQAAAVLVPSRWEEPCPYSAIDAQAAGVPVLASALGGLPELLDERSLLAPDDQGAWTSALAQLWGDCDLRRDRGEQALERARGLLGEDSFYERLLEAYAGA